MTKADIGKSEDLKIFTSQCVFMRSIYEHFSILFDKASGQDRERMLNVSETFFGDLNHVLIEYIILQVCKISDPAKDFRQNTNHTIAFLIQHYEISDDKEFAVRVAELNDSIQNFREKMLPARNKVISHADRDAILASHPLGGATKDMWDQFWRDLTEILKILHERVYKSQFLLNEVGMLSDADGLLKALLRASFFEQLARDENPVIAKRCAEIALG